MSRSTTWTTIADFKRLSKKARLSKCIKSTSVQRFGDRRSKDEIKAMVKGYVPPNTAKSTSWALKTFKEWIAENKKKVSVKND